MPKINVRNCNKLANFMEQHVEIPFLQATGTFPIARNSHCGSAGCIAGFGATLWNNMFRRYDKRYFADFSGPIAKRLGLSTQQKQQLFTPQDYSVCFKDKNYSTVYYEAITRAGAVTTLRRLAKTGEVEWYHSEQVA